MKTVKKKALGTLARKHEWWAGASAQLIIRNTISGLHAFFIVVIKTGRYLGINFSHKMLMRGTIDDYSFISGF